MNRLAVIALLAAALPALAQVRPDAGSIQRDLDRDRVPPARGTSAPPTLEEPARPAMRAPASARFLVKGFRITRSQAFPEAEIVAQLREFVGKELSLADLQRATEVVTAYYRDRGYFVARAYVPGQEIRDGVVEITVLEGHLSAIQLKMETELRLRPSVVRRTLNAAMPEGMPIRADALDRGLLLLNDLPGIEARAVLAPGQQLGTTDLNVELREGPLVTGQVEADNHGNKFTGRYRLGGTVNLNNPLGLGDQVQLRGALSDGTDHLRLAYSLPVGGSGLRLEASYAQGSYRLCCEFAALEAEGSTRVASFLATYPFVRGRERNLYGWAGVERRRFVNDTIAGNTSDKSVDALMLAVHGDARDGWLGGGYNTGGIAVLFGQLDLDRNPGDRAGDNATARTHGAYTRTWYRVARLQYLGGAHSLHGALTGQLASRNLESSEKFVLGGPTAVRAYPIGEAAGDEGLLFNLEYRYEFLPGLRAAAFVDHGSVRLHRNPWANWQGGNARLRNSYSLSGVGIGVDWSQPGNFLIRASIAQRLGDNPGRDLNDNDSDNTRNRIQFWLQGTRHF